MEEDNNNNDDRLKQFDNSASADMPQFHFKSAL